MVSCAFLLYTLAALEARTAKAAGRERGTNGTQGGVLYLWWCRRKRRPPGPLPATVAVQVCTPAGAATMPALRRAAAMTGAWGWGPAGAVNIESAAGGGGWCGGAVGERACCSSCAGGRVAAGGCCEDAGQAQSPEACAWLTMAGRIIECKLMCDGAQQLAGGTPTLID